MNKKWMSLNKVRYMTAMSAILISGTALLGWWTDHAALVAYLPGIANMTFNTALCFMLVALTCITPERGEQTSAAIRLSVGLFVGLFAVLSQLQGVLDLNLGIDNLLFDSRGHDLLSPYPGRMSPLTSAGFLFIGISFCLLSMHHYKPGRFASTSHAMILLVGLVGLTGIGMNVIALEVYDAHLSSISLFTAISFLLVAVATVGILKQQRQKHDLNLLLYSGIELMYKLKYPQKFVLISIVLVLPVAVLMWNEIQLAERNVVSAHMKTTGIEHIRLNVELLKAIPEHRGMVNVRFTNPDLFSQALIQKTTQIDQLLETIADLDQLHAGIISIPQAWLEITSNWASIKANQSDRLLQWRLHTEIITQIARHLREVGDESRLTFDEDPFLHNLLTAQIKEMPELLEQIGQLRGRGTGLVLHKNISRDEQLTFASMITRTDYYLEEMQRLLRSAPDSQGSKHLVRLHTTMVDKIRIFIAMVEQQFMMSRSLPLSANSALTQEDYFQQASSAIDHGYKLYSASLTYVEQRLHQRIHEYITIQRNIKLTAILLILALLFLFASFYQSVMNTIQALDKTARNMRRGDVDELAIFPASDELSDIVGSFNTIAKELMRVNSHMRAVVDYAVDGIISINCKSVIKSFNPAAEQIFGYSADEVVGKNITMLMPETYHERHLSDLQHYCETGEGRVLGQYSEMHGLRKNGDIFPLELSINSMFIDNDQMFIGMVRDLSEHREMEDQLRHAQKMEAIGELIGGVAHNFNNLLAGIVGKAYLAKQFIHKQPEKALGYINSIESISAQAGDMVKQLLTFARKDFFRDKEEMSLVMLIHEGFKTAKLGIAEDIDLSLTMTTAEVIVMCDGNHIQQVLMNLMNNARDAVAGCEEKSILVSLDVCRPDAGFFNRHCELAADDYACLRVTDSGHGMNEKTLARIFEPFYTTKGAGEGTGLGLSSAFGTITAHGGVIEVESKLDSGTIFRVYLPLFKATKIKIENNKQPDVLPSSGHETLLLVDDEPIILHAMQEVFEELGYKVITAQDGAEGLACFQLYQHEIDVIVTDVVMPKVGGVEMCQKIRCIDADIPVVFLTGYDQGNLQLQSDEMENIMIISKPVQTPELSQSIMQILKKRIPVPKANMIS